MPFTTPLVEDSVNTDNTGTYKGYQIWVKGDGRVQATRDDETYIVNSVMNAKYWIDAKEATTPPPVVDVAPVLASLDPATVALGAADFPLHIHGSGFTASSVIMFAGQPEPIVFMSDAEISTIVKPSLGWGEVTLPVSVKNGAEESNVLDFTFTAPAARRVRKA